MERVRKRKRLLGIVMSMVIIFSMLQGIPMVVNAEGENASSSWVVNDDGTMSVSEETAASVVGNLSDNSITMVLIGTLEGKISDFTAGDGVTVKISSEKDAAMILYSTAPSNDTIKSVLQTIKFSSDTTQVHFDVTTGETTTSIMNDINNTSTVTFGIKNAEGVAHAYKYVAFTSGDTKSWLYAFHKSVTGTDTLGGLKGYLATVTTSTEANLLNDFIASATSSDYGNGAWIAGTSLTYKASGDGAASKITPGHYDSTQFTAYQSGEGEYIRSNTSSVSDYRKEYYWACGPEMGQQVPTNLWNNGEPNNSSGEYCAVSSWQRNPLFNDFPAFNGSVGGYFLEFSVYAGGIANGGSYNSVTIYNVLYDGNGNEGGTTPAPGAKEVGKNLTIADNTGKLTKTGYVFDGWNTESDGSGTDYPAGADYGKNVTAKLYAKWKLAPASAPDIITQPLSVTNLKYGYTEGSVSVEAKAADDTEYDLSYQWYSNTINSNTGGTKIEGATAETFDIPTGYTVNDSPLYYYCVVTATRKDNGETASVNSDVGIVKINKLVVTVTADRITKEYGEDDPELTYTAEGLLEDDEFTGSLIREEGEETGSYAIRLGTLSAGDNYIISFSPAVFVISKSDIDVNSPKANSLTYNGKDQELVTAGSSDFGSIVYSLDGVVYSEDIPVGKDAGLYTVYYKSTGDDNHEESDVQKLNVTILPKMVTITADDVNKEYGEEDPELTFEVEGLVEGDALTGKLSRDEGEEAGTYDITIGTLSAGDNYNISFNGAELKINPSPEPELEPEPVVEETDDNDYHREWVDGQWYDANGDAGYAPQGSWHESDKGWWYGDTSGWYAMDGWMKVDGKWYFFDEFGYMITGQYAGKWMEDSNQYYWVGADGAWDESDPAYWHLEGTSLWFGNSTWYASDCTILINGYWHTFDSAGFLEQ